MSYCQSACSETASSPLHPFLRPQCALNASIQHVLLPEGYRQLRAKLPRAAEDAPLF